MAPAGTGFDHLIFGHHEVIDAMQELSHADRTTFVMFAMVLGLVLCKGSWFLVCTYLTRNIPDERKRFKFGFWFLHLFLGTVSLISLFVFVDVSVLVNGTLNTGLRTGEIRNEWSQPLGWLQVQVNSFYFVGYTVVPILVLYGVEVLQFGSFECNLSLMLHHVIVIFWFCFVYKAWSATLNPRWGQCGFISFLHVCGEGPMWLGLMVYRLKMRFAKQILLAGVIYEICLRICVWIGSALVYISMCWLAPVYTPYEVSWRHCFLLLFPLKVVVQTYTCMIRTKLYLKLRARDSKSSPDPTGRSSDTSHSDVVIATTHTVPISCAFATDAELGRVCGCQGNECMTSSPEAQRCNGPPAAVPPPGAKFRLLGNAMVYVATLACFALIFATSVLDLEDNHYAEVRKGQRIAIVGGGVAGLGAAWAFKRSEASNQFQVTVFEPGHVGGAAYTHYSSHGGLPLDLGVVAFNEEYRNFRLLLQELDISPEPFVFGINTVLRNSGNTSEDKISGPHLHRDDMHEQHGDEMNRLMSLLDKAIDQWSEESLMTVTIADFLRMHAFSSDFADDAIVPCLSNVLAASRATLLDTSLAAVHFMDELFGILKICATRQTVRLEYVREGYSEYISRLEKLIFESEDASEGEQGNLVRLRKQKVTGVQSTRGVLAHGLGPVRLLVGEDGEFEEFDEVIFAVQRRPLANILFGAESSVCEDSRPCAQLFQAAFGEGTSRTDETVIAVAHNDSALVEHTIGQLVDSQGCLRPNVYNFFRDTTIGVEGVLLTPPALQEEMPSCSHGLQPPFGFYMVKKPDSLWSDLSDLPAEYTPAPGTIERRVDWNTHTAHDPQFMLSNRRLHVVQGLGGLWFAGGDTFFNLHEPALVTGLAVAHRLGAGYPFAGNALAERVFMAARAWILHGLNPFVPDRAHSKLARQQEPAALVSL